MIRSTRDQLEGAGLGEASFYSMFPIEICVKSEYLDLVPVVQLQSGERTIFVDTGDGYIDGIFGERDITSGKEAGTKFSHVVFIYELSLVKLFRSYQTDNNQI